MEGKIFDELRHPGVNSNRPNTTTNGGKQAVNMVLKKLNLHILLRYLMLK